MPLDAPSSLPDIAIGVDVGGTFTDIVVIDRKRGTLLVDKVLSTPGRLEAGIMNGLRKVLGDGAPLRDALSRGRVVHATTQATNALIESKTARVGLITNRGFRDIIEIRRHYRTDLYNMFMEAPIPLVPRELRLEIDARMDFTGAILAPVNREQAAAVIRELHAAGVESYAICFLHSYARPDQEEMVAEIGRAIDPRASFTCSSGVCPEYREYERTSTAVVNAAVMPIVDRYLGDLERTLRDNGYDRDLYIMQSNGGMMLSQEIRRTPVNIIESGPAAGVVAAAAIGALTGRPNLLSFDMGGTTAKAALIHDGRIEMTNEYEVSAGGHGAERQQGYPIRVPVMEIAEVGSGGGSIAWVDEGGALRVGPKSAGAEPGPVCYRRGGTRPTTTDANLVLGRLSAGYFLGGEMALDVEGARAAIERDIAVPLGMDLMEAAAGIIEVANSHMVRALRQVSVEKGRHPRDYALVAFGGAGPLQAAALAEELEVQQVIVPQFPGVASAVGMLGADVRHDYQEACFGFLDEIDAARIADRLRSLAARAIGDVRRCGLPDDMIRVIPSADLRYVGQAYEIRVEWPSVEVSAADAAEMIERFQAEHKRLYSFSTPGRRVEMVSLRVTAFGTIGKLATKGPGSTRKPPQPKETRAVFFRGAGAVDCPVFDRPALKCGQAIVGPAIVEQKDSTTVVPAGWSTKLDAFGHLILTRQKERTAK